MKLAVGLCILFLSCFWGAAAQAAGFEQLSRDVDFRLIRPHLKATELEQIEESLLQMYFWSKDNFEVREWPEYWQKWETWSEALRHQKEPVALVATVRASYGLACHDYRLVRDLLADLSRSGPAAFYTGLLQALLGEQDPDLPGVWRIPLAQARQMVHNYPNQELAHVLLAEAILERQVGIPDAEAQALLREAQRSVSRALLLNPALDYARYQQGQIYYLQGDQLKAHHYFEKELLPVGAVAAEAVGNFYSWFKDDTDALDFWERARVANPDNRRLYQKMEQADLQSKPELAVKLYLQGLKADPDQAFFYQKLRQLYGQASPQKLAVWLDETFEPSDYFYSLIRGDLVQSPQAVDWYQKALNQNPERMEAYLNLLDLLWQQHNHKEMAQVLKIAREEDLESPELIYWQGVLALDEDHPDQAIALLTPLAKQDFRARYTLMMAYKHKKDYAQAYHILASLLEQEPQNFSLLLSLGDLYLEQGRFKEAQQAYLWADRVEPYHEQVLFSFGILYTQMKEYDKAAEAYEKASLLKPEDLDIRNNLGNVFLQQERLDAAEEVFAAILKHDPTYASAYYNLACVHALRQQREEAYRDLQQAFQLKPDLKKMAATDPDLDFLRGDKRFRELMH